MLRRIGLTGNMGSGKTLVASVFGFLGIPVYNADLRARTLMEESSHLRFGIQELLGPTAYLEDGSLNRAGIAAKVFSYPVLLQALNALVHPVVAQDSRQWAEQQSAAYTLHEAALLVQSGAFKDMYANILVAAPELMRIDRVRLRNKWSDKEILDRLRNQWPEEKLRPYCRFEIRNDGSLSLIEQVLAVHRGILKELG